MQNVLDASDVVVLEGTGHTAVGSVVDLNNAQVLSIHQYLVPTAVLRIAVFFISLLYFCWKTRRLL